MHILLAILDYWSIQDRQFITFATIEDCYSILNCEVLFLTTTVGDEWSYASRQRCTDQSIHNRRICPCDQIHEGLSYIKDPMWRPLYKEGSLLYRTYIKAFEYTEGPHIKTLVHTSNKCPHTKVLIQSSLCKNNCTKDLVWWSLYTFINRGPSIKALVYRSLY